MDDVLDLLTPAPELRWLLLVVNVPSMLVSLYSLRWTWAVLGEWRDRETRLTVMAYVASVACVWFEAWKASEVLRHGGTALGIVEMAAWALATCLLMVFSAVVLLDRLLDKWKPGGGLTWSQGSRGDHAAATAAAGGW